RQRTHHPRVDRVDWETRRVRNHDRRIARADLVEAVLDRIDEETRVALGLDVAVVIPIADHALPGWTGEALWRAGAAEPRSADLALIVENLRAVAGVLRAADVALAPHKRRARLTLHEALDRRQEIGGMQSVAVEAFRMLAPVRPDRDRLGR